MVRNLTVSERRKLPGQYKYVEVKPEMIELAENLKQMNITQQQLVALGMLIGTDYNYGGIKGIGPKHGIKLVQKFGITDFTIKLKPHEEKDEMAEIQRDIARADYALRMQQLGFNVTLTPDGDFASDVTYLP